MHRICIALALHLLCICIKSGKYCHPDIAKPPFSGISVPKITPSKNHVFMQRSNAAMHMECICIALVMQVYYMFGFQCFLKSHFSSFGAFSARAIHLQCIWNAGAMHLHQKYFFRCACYIKYIYHLCSVLQ